jgi:uncharacterized membrane protein YsdA (DUF1294 family)
MVSRIIYIYLIVINIYSFIIVNVDKYKALKHKWRIKESNFFALAFLGGALGIFISMKIFRHKIRYNRFRYGIPFIILLNIITFYWIIRIFDDLNKALYL